MTMSRVTVTPAGAFQKSFFERWVATVRFVAAGAAPWIAAGTAAARRKAWEDARNSSAAGGIASAESNNTVANGKMPSSKAVDLHTLAVQVVASGGSAVLTEAALNAILNNTNLFIEHQSNTYDLGRLVEWAAPWGTATHRATTSVEARPLPAPFHVNPNEEIAFRLEVVEDIGGTALTAAQNVDVRLVFGAVTDLRDSQVIKQ